jgi:hypothetical protein
MGVFEEKPPEVDPEKGGASGAEMDSGAYDDATKDLSNKYAEAVKNGDTKAAEAIRVQIKSKIRESIRPVLEASGVPADSVENVLDTIDEVNEIFRNATDGEKGLTDANTAINKASPEVRSGMQKFVDICNNACAKVREWFVQLGKMVGFDSKAHFDSVDSNHEKFVKDYDRADGTADTRAQDIENYNAERVRLADEFEKGLNTGEAKRKGEEASGGKSNWDKVLSAMKVLAVVGGILALCWQLALMGADNDGCYRFILGDGNTSGTGPIPGSQKVSILGRGGGSTDGDCNVAPNTGNSITEESCTCGAEAEDSKQAADAKFVGAACLKTDDGATGAPGEGGAGVGGDAYPYCCQGPPGGVRNPACTSSFGTKGDVYYQWSQTDPSDILANILNGADTAAKSLANTAADIWKDLLSALGPLKWIIFGIVGLIIFWGCIEIGMAIYGKVKGPKPNTIEVMRSEPPS